MLCVDHFTGNRGLKNDDGAAVESSVLGLDSQLEQAEALYLQPLQAASAEKRPLNKLQKQLSIRLLNFLQ